MLNTFNGNCISHRVTKLKLDRFKVFKDVSNN